MSALTDPAYAELLARPHDDDAWAAYAAVLRASDDPRAGLIGLEGDALLRRFEELAPELLGPIRDALSVRHTLVGGRVRTRLLYDLLTPEERARRGAPTKPGILGRLFGAPPPPAPVDDEHGLVELVRFDWRLGFVTHARVATTFDYASTRTEVFDPAELLEDLLSTAKGRFLQTLTLGPWSQGDDVVLVDYASAFSAMERAGEHLGLRELYIGDFEVEEAEISWSSVGEAGALWSLYPRLERLTLRGGDIDPGTIAHDHLRSLELITGGLPRVAIDALIGARLPKLEALHIWFGDPDYGAEGDIDSVRALLGIGAAYRDSAPRFPALRALGLMNATFSDAMVETLPGSPLLPQLRTLDLSLGTLTDVGAQQLAAHAGSFAHLTGIDLSENYVSASVQREVEASFAALGAPTKLSWGRQDVAEEWDGEAHYYVSVGE